MNLSFSLPLSQPPSTFAPFLCHQVYQLLNFRPITSRSIGSFVQHHTITMFSNTISVKGNKKTKKERSQRSLNLGLYTGFAKYML